MRTGRHSYTRRRSRPMEAARGSDLRLQRTFISWINTMVYGNPVATTPPLLSTCAVSSATGTRWQWAYSRALCPLSRRGLFWNRLLGCPARCSLGRLGGSRLHPRLSLSSLATPKLFVSTFLAILPEPQPPGREFFCGQNTQGIRPVCPMCRRAVATTVANHPGSASS